MRKKPKRERVKPHRTGLKSPGMENAYLDADLAEQVMNVKPLPGQATPTTLAARLRMVLRFGVVFRESVECEVAGVEELLAKVRGKESS